MLSKAQTGAQELIKTLEGEKMRLEHQLSKYVKEPAGALAATQQALIAKDKTVNDISSLQNQQMNKFNSAGTRGEQTQTDINDVNMVIKVERKDQMYKPEIPGEFFEYITCIYGL